MDAEEVKRRLARITVHFVEPGAPNDGVEPLPAFVTRVLFTPEEREEFWRPILAEAKVDESSTRRATSSAALTTNKCFPHG